MATIDKKSLNLPHGSNTLQVESLKDKAQQLKYIQDAINVVGNNYDDFAKNEDPQKWLEHLNSNGQPGNGTKLFLTVIEDKDHKVIGANVIEVYDPLKSHSQGDERVGLISYTVGPVDGRKTRNPTDPHYQDIITALKLEGNEAVKKSGINATLFQEHKYVPENTYHMQKVEAGQKTGQVLLTQSGLVNTQYVIPLTNADYAAARKEVGLAEQPSPNDNPAIVEKAEQAMNSNGAKADLFISDIHTPNKPLAKALAEFNAGYLDNNGAATKTNAGRDSLDAIAKELDPNLTVGEAYKDLKAGYDKRLEFDLATAPKVIDSKEAEDHFKNLSASQQAQAIRSFVTDNKMADAYKAAGSDKALRAQAIKDFPQLTIAYEVEKNYVKEVGKYAEKEHMQAFMHKFEASMENTIRDGSLGKVQETSFGHKENAHTLAQSEIINTHQNDQANLHTIEA